MFISRHSSNAMIVEVQRPRPVTYEHTEDSPWDSIGQANLDLCNDLRYDLDDLDKEQTNETVPQIFTIREDLEDKENQMSSMADETIYTSMDHAMASLATSTPLPLLARGHRVSRNAKLAPGW